MCAQNDTVEKMCRTRSRSFFMFNTDVYICLYLNTQSIESADKTLQEIYEQCLYFEHHLSRTREDSDISRAAVLSPHAVKVCPEVLELMDASRTFESVSDGAFDVTMGSVTQLWDFHNKVVPSAFAVHKALEHVGIHHVHTNKQTGTLTIDDTSCKLDFGGIAKGYIADKLSCYLQREGYTSFLLNLGGNVVVHGGRLIQDGEREPFCIGVAHPTKPQEHIALLNLKEASVVTSGIHERSFYWQGKFYHHILDARTGFPARSDLVSTTIVSDTSIDGDAYATISFLKGLEETKRIVDKTPGIEALCVDIQGDIWVSSGLQQKVIYSNKGAR